MWNPRPKYDYIIIMAPIKWETLLLLLFILGDAWDIRGPSTYEQRTYGIWLVTAKRQHTPLNVVACKEAYIAVTDKPVSDL